MSDSIFIPILIQDQDIRAIVERAKEMGLIADNTPDPWVNKPAALAESRSNCPINADEVFGKELRVYDKPAAPADASDLLSAGQVVAGPTPYIVAMVQSHPTLKVGDIVRMGDTGRPKHDSYLIRDDFSLHAIAGENDQYVLLKRWQPAAPADDEATIENLATILIAARTVNYYDDARLILAAIRRGEVPGLTTTSEVDEFRRQFAETLENCMRDADERHARVVTERDTVKAEVDRLRRGDVTDLVSKIHQMEKERDAAIARAEKEKAEADEMHDEALKNLKDKVNAEIQRDADRAAHAEAMELLRGFDAVRPIGFMRSDQQVWDYNRSAHLAKYGKDAKDTSK